MKLVVTYMDSLATSKPFDLLARSRRNKVDRKIYKSRVGTTAISVKHARIICAVNLGVDTAHPLQDPNGPLVLRNVRQSPEFDRPRPVYNLNKWKEKSNRNLI